MRRWYEPKYGGLSGLLALFRSKGLGQQVESWIADGPNMEVSGEQMEQAVGSPSIDSIAKQLHLTHGEARDDIARVLPQVVDRLTPDGEVPENDNDLISRGLSMLRGGDA